ncbi:hypothetical protein PIROE2DRAFT_67503, partial [Piromyces sp. E2]
MDNNNTNIDIPKNLNILSQEEVQLLKMKKNNLQAFMDDDDDDDLGFSSRNKNNKLMKTAGISVGGMQKPNKQFNTPDMNAVAPFNYMGNDLNTPMKNPENIFTIDSTTEDSFYDDPIINKLGKDIKIETKKIEYEDETNEGPINKLKIKRFN